MNKLTFFFSLFLFALSAFAGGEPTPADTSQADSIITIPIVTAERLPSNYGAVHVNTPELDSTVVATAAILFDSLDSARGVLLDIRAVWPGVREADSLQTPFFKALLDSAPVGPLAILTKPRWPGNEQMATLASHRPFTKFDFSGNLDEGRRTLITTVFSFEKGGGKTIEEMKKLREQYPGGIIPNIPKQPTPEKK